MKKISELISGNRLVNNVSWIFWGNVFHAFLAFLLNIYVARKLSLNDNGLIAYSTSWITFFSSVGTLGFSGIISREFSKKKDNANECIWSCIWARVLFSIFAICALQIIVYVSDPNDSLLRIIVLCQSTTILFSSFDIFVYWYRYVNKAKVTACYRLLAFSFSATWRIISIQVLNNIVFYVIGISLETALFILFLLFFYRNHYSKSICIRRQTIFKMLRMSYPFIFSAILSTIYGQSDKIMLKSMVGNSAVALYNAATTLASLVVIIPTTLIEGFRPEIMDAKLSDEILYQRRLRQLYAVVFWSSIVYCVFITCFAKQIVLLIYGEKYVGATPALSLVVWYTTFSYFGAINNVYMVAEEIQKWVLLTTMTGAVANIIMNTFLIPTMGIIGAALASLVTQILANFIMMMIIPELRKGFIITLFSR